LRISVIVIGMVLLIFGAWSQRTLAAVNWLDICRIPMVDAVIAEPCETLTSPDGYDLTPDGQRVLKCIAGGGLLLLADPSGNALREAQSLGPAVGCGASSSPGGPPESITTNSSAPIGTNATSSSTFPETNTPVLPDVTQPLNTEHVPLSTIIIEPGSSNPNNVPNNDLNDKFYFPSIMDIAAGLDDGGKSTTLEWRNDDNVLHTVTSGAPGNAEGAMFDSGYISEGKNYIHTFASRGSYPYFCTLHPYMKGLVRVN
jgi:plastocyanin